MRTLSNLIRIRKEKGYTQKELANIIGVSKQYIWDIENGRREISYKLAFMISEVLETKPDVLFFEDYKKSLK